MDPIESEREKDKTFLISVARQEVSRIRAKIDAQAARTVDGGNEAVTSTLLGELGSLSARLLIIEEAIECKLLEVSTRQAPLPAARKPISLERGVPIEDIHDAQAFHAVEEDVYGRRFAWTSGPEVSVKLPAGPPSDKYLQITFVAIIKPKYAKSLQLFINGKKQSHRVYAKGSSLCIECAIPKMKSESAIELTLKLPDVHSLSELNAGPELRKLGIAISAIQSAQASEAPFLKRMFGF